MSEITLSPEILACIQQCEECHRICLNMATGHCLKKGGRHVETEHLRTMLICAEVCRTAASVMTIGTGLHRQVCAVCADICDACISSCRDLDDMAACIHACQRCKTSCESMTG
ncbi:MAG: four-helix bundle copper-binding protein [Bacteroidota bacterium]